MSQGTSNWPSGCAGQPGGARVGLTLVEVLVALTIVGVVVSVLTTATLSSVRQNATAGSRTQAVQVLSYLGRLVAAGDSSVLEGERAWDYGTLASEFRELAEAANPALYRAALEELGEVGIREARMVHYRVRVCWQAPNDEVCVTGDTAGPRPGASNESGPLPGIN